MKKNDHHPSGTDMTSGDTTAGSDFHFYHEIRKEKYYDPLIPRKETGLVVVLLYEKWKSGRYPNNIFPEEAVKNAIEQVASDFGKTYERTPHERFKEANLHLQQYFILRNEDSNLYNITQYGIDFCERIREKILLEFNPSLIEKILADLIDSLKKYLDTDFEYWFSYHFTLQQSTIKNQAETLLRQVDYSVKEFRAATKANDVTFLETVRKVDKSLEIISRHSEELRGAFYDSEEIRALLTQLSFTEVTSEKLAYRESVRSFLDSINNDLNIISQRIERIRPKLRQFISSVNQRTFDRNTELFLRSLLKNSKLARENNKKVIRLPFGMIAKQLSQATTNFKIVEPGRIRHKVPTPILLPREDVRKRQERLEMAEDRMHIRERVRTWLMQIETEIGSVGNLYFTTWYFRILETEKTFADTISIRVASQLFTKYSKLKNYTVAVDQTLERDVKFPNHTIWKMTLKTALK